MGQRLTATVSDLADRDGLATSPSYTFTWTALDGDREQRFATSTGSGPTATALLTPTQAGKTVKVEVAFEDHIGNAETLESAVYPDFGAIAWNADAACAMPDLAGRELVWTGRVTVGELVASGNIVGYGYSNHHTGSGLSDARFDLGGTDYAIGALNVGNDGDLDFSTTTDLPATATSALRLHVCGDSFDFSDATYSGSPNFDYTWASSGLDWSGHATRRVYLSQADTTAPTLLAMEVDGATLTMTYDEALKATSPVGGGGNPVFRVAVGDNTFTLSGVRAGVGTNRNQVAMTLDPPAEPGQTVVMSFHGTNATAASRVQDLAGNDAATFLANAMPVPIRNLTPEGPHVDAVAFAGAAATYAIGGVIGVDLTFDESVTVTGRPRLQLRIGAETVLAPWKTGQSAGTMHRFEYVVAEGDADADGIAVVAHSLELDGGTIRASDDGEDVRLDHRSRRDPARRVDGVRPAASSASVAGPVLTLTWSEPLDAASAPSGSGGFTVRIGGTAEPALRSVEIDAADRRILRLALARSIREGAADVTLDYAPQPATALRDRAGNDAAAFADLAVTAGAADNNPASGRVAISGTPTVGQILTAALSDLADRDGLAEAPSYTFTWIALDGGTETTIHSSTTNLARGSYRLRPAQAGKTVKVEVAFEDHIGNDETLESAVYPDFGAIAWNTDAACAMPDLAGREQVWTGLVTVGAASIQISGSPGAYGYSALSSPNDIPGSTLSDNVVLSEAAGSAVTVDYATRDITAVAGDDYVAASGTLTFQPGERYKEILVRVLPDDHDEGSETMALALSNAAGAAISDAEGVGTIFNSDPIPRAWLARFGRAVADQVLEAIQGRLRATPAPGAEVALAGERIGGQALNDAAMREEEARQKAAALAAWFKGEDPGSGSGTGDPDDPLAASGAGPGSGRAVALRELLTGSSFALTGGTSGSGLVTLWGRAASSRFDGREGELTLDGELVTGMLGAEWMRRRWTAGLILARSTAEGGWSGAPADAGSDGDAPASGGTVEAELTGAFPWARHALTERLEAWGAAGYGQGKLTVTPGRPSTDEAGPESGSGAGAPIRADLDLKIAAGGLRGTLLEGEDLTLTGKTDALAVETASGRGRGANGGNLEPARATTTRLRLGVEASRPFMLGGGAVFTPSLETGLRHDGGDAETGFGLDLGGGLALSAPEAGLQAEIRGRGLLSHESRGFRERGFSGALSWHQRPGSDRGATLSLTQTIGGASAGGADALLARATLDGLAADPGDELRSRRFEVKLGYGLTVFDDRFTLTPEAGAGFSDSGRDYSLGWRLTGGPTGSGGAFELGIEGRRREPANDDEPPEHSFGIRLNVRF